jgi:glycosyltransferase involved in cell wall biosynthesis
MRILIVTSHRTLVGGVEKYLEAAMPGLIGRGHEIGLVHENPALPGAETIDSRTGSLPSWRLTQADAKHVLDSIAKWKPEVVYSHGLDRPESVEIERRLLERYRAVLYIHNYDRTCATGRKCYSFPEIQSCTRRLGPLCLVLHYPRRCGGLHPGLTWKLYQHHTALNGLLPRYRAILVASTHMYRELERHDVGAEKLHLVRLPATDSTPETAAPRSKTFSGRILLVGRLTDIKGAGHLIQALPRAAAKLHRTLKLTVAGDGPERQSLERLAARTGVDVEFAGWVQTPEKLDLMRRADLLAVPSLWPEPFGLVGVEAGCIGLPSVAYRVGGIPDWLVAGETGELAPGDPPTVDGLSDAIVRALDSPEHYRELSVGAWKMAQHFTLPAHLDQLEPILAGEVSTANLNAPSLYSCPEVS